MEEVNSENAAVDNLASRWSRLWAAIIDSILAMVIIIPTMSYFGVWGIIKEKGELPLEITIIFALFGWFVFFIMHGHLLNKYGQTIGKRILDISIVTMSGEKPSFWSIILKRYLPMSFAGYIPLAGRVLPIIDVLFIFRKDKRCVHDMIAGTKVVNASANKRL